MNKHPKEILCKTCNKPIAESKMYARGWYHIGYATQWCYYDTYGHYAEPKNRPVSSQGGKK